jgi:hypothetical protein
MPARGPGAVSEGIAGGLMIVIRQPHHRGFSASHWHPGTSVAEDSRRLDGAESLLGVQICVPCSVRVRPPCCMATFVADAAPSLADGGDCGAALWRLAS